MTGDADTAGLTAEGRRTYERIGVVRIPGAVPQADVGRMADALWTELERRHGIFRDRPDTWTIERPFHLQAASRSGAFAAMASVRVRAILDDLLGPGWVEPRR